MANARGEKFRPAEQSWQLAYTIQQRPVKDAELQPMTQTDGWPALVYKG